MSQMILNIYIRCQFHQTTDSVSKVHRLVSQIKYTYAICCLSSDTNLLAQYSAEEHERWIKYRVPQKLQYYCLSKSKSRG
jgi:hypothetical protein